MVGGVRGRGAVRATHAPHTTRSGRSMRGRYASHWNASLFTVKIERFLYSTDVAPPMNGSLRQGGTWSGQHGTRVTINSYRQIRYSSYGSVVCVNTAYIICGCHCTIRILA